MSRFSTSRQEHSDTERWTVRTSVSASRRSIIACSTQSTSEIVNTAKRTGARVRGPDPAADEHRAATPSTARRMSTRSRASSLRSAPISVCSTLSTRAPQTVDALMKLDLAAGVDVEIKLSSPEAVPDALRIDCPEAGHDTNFRRPKASTSRSRSSSSTAVPGRRGEDRGDRRLHRGAARCRQGQGQERLQGRSRPLRQGRGRAEEEAGRVPRQHRCAADRR